MRAQLSNVLVVVGMVSSSMASIVSADPILEPVAASTNMGEIDPQHTPANVINQSGLSTGYVSGTTDFDTYVASTKHSTSINNYWMSRPGSRTGDFDFDLGGSYIIESLALWNIGNNFGINLRQFDLYASSDASFSTTTLLGSFDANANLGPTTATSAQVFTFGPTTASFVRMVIVSNDIHTPVVGFGQAAFEEQAAAVPEPGSLLMLTSGLTGLFVAARRHRLGARRTLSALAN